MELYQLVYQSQSLVPFEAPELTALLHQSRAYNKCHGITGILLFTPDGRFMQVLEGDRDTVRHLYFDRIAADPRHYHLQLISEGPCQQRSFANWTMAFHMAQAHDLRQLLSPLPPDTPAQFVPRPPTRPELLTLLLDFVAKRKIQV